MLQGAGAAGEVRCQNPTLALCASCSRSYMTCVRLNTGWKYCLIGVLAGMGLGILKAS